MKKTKTCEQCECRKRIQRERPNRQLFDVGRFGRSAQMAAGSVGSTVGGARALTVSLIPPPA